MSHCKKRKIIVQEHSGPKTVARPQGLAQAAVERVVVPLLADLQFLPIGPDVAEHQAAGSIAVIRKEMPRRFRTCRSSKMANTTPAAKPMPPQAALTPSVIPSAAVRK